jgi:deazaflavin-dependent oxidoreductase (nitroreductase family)
MQEVPAVRPRPTGFARVFARAPVLLYRLGLGGLVGKSILLLTTTGRRTGRARATPLNYREEGGIMYVVAGRGGPRADWYRNLVARPDVEVQLGRRRLEAVAAPVSDAQEKARVLWLFAQRSRRRAQRYFGIPRSASREERRALASEPGAVAMASRQTVVALRPRK